MGDVIDKTFYRIARGDEKQYINYKGWQPGENITL